MKNLLSWFPAYAVVILSCASWVGALSYAAMRLLHFPPAIDFSLAGALGVIAIFSLISLVQGIRHPVKSTGRSDLADPAGGHYWRSVDRSKPTGRNQTKGFH